MSQVAADIRAIANLIENVGHTQSGYYRVLDEDGNCTGYCVYGALAAVLGLQWSGGMPNTTRSPRYNAVSDALAKHLGIGVAHKSDTTPTPQLLAKLRWIADQEDNNA